MPLGTWFQGSSKLSRPLPSLRVIVTLSRSFSPLPSDGKVELTSLANIVLSRWRGEGKLPSLGQKLLNEPPWEVRRHKTFGGTTKKPVLLELRDGIKEE